MSYATAKACALVSNIIPAVIACNAESGLRAHAGLGYNRRRMVAIPNGCDTIRFASSPALRARARTMFGFSSDDIVIGTIGRFAPHKDYRTFVRAAARLILANGRVRVLMAGRGLDSGNRVLQEWVAETGYPQRFVLAGEQDDSVACFSALDVFCLSSISEGFPNVVTEAMAMEVPCVVTDAGDARDIVGDTGWTVASGNADALAAALLVVVRASREDRAARGRQARQRVRSLFSVERTGAEFEGLYAGLVKRPGDRVDACFDDERTVQR
jgi:glycosyltransferase involved in cell wall biosynthesis